MTPRDPNPDAVCSTEELRGLAERAFHPSGSGSEADSDAFEAYEFLTDHMHKWLPALLAEPDADKERVERLEAALRRIAAPMPGCSWAATERQEIARQALEERP